MELGALICTPRLPDCQACPVEKLCIARKKGLQESLPTLGQREAATQRRFTAFVVERNGEFLVRQRPAGDVNAHLWEFPNAETGVQLVSDFRLTSTKPLCTIKHSITRYRITLEAWHAELTNGARASGTVRQGHWRSLRQLHKLAFTSAHKKVLQTLSQVRPAI